MGSARFGIFENFKKTLAQRNGSKGAPGELKNGDIMLAAFGTGIFSSFLVVRHTQYRALFNTLE